MKVLKLFLAVVIGVAFILSAEDLSAGRHSGKMMKCKDRFIEMDANKDGKISLEEFKAVKHPQGDPDELFKSRDADKDGALTEEELCSGGVKKGRGRGR